MWTPDAQHCHHQPDTTHLDPTPPKEALDVVGDLSSGDFPTVDQLSRVGKGAVWRVGLWDGAAPQALFADAPVSVLAGPRTCPFHRTFLSRSARAPTSRSSRSLSGACSYSWGACTDRDLQGGQRRYGVGDPLRHVGRCSPGAADHAVACGGHCPSVAVTQMLEGRGMVNHMPM